MIEFQKTEKTKISVEKEAELALQKILDDPDNAFLSEHLSNREKIDNAETAAEALSIAKSLILKRLEGTFKMKSLGAVEGIEEISVNIPGIIKMLDSIKANQQRIGSGLDAFVVIDKSECNELPAEICYKVEKKEKIQRGRNVMSAEVNLHEDFYRLAEDNSELGIGVPTPYYLIEIGNDKVFAMEKLPATSMKDILAGIGKLPDWLDVDVFCSNLNTFIETLHNNNLYHRDTNFGNIMISQSDDMPEDGKWGYLIDFGLSAYVYPGDDPYKVTLVDNDDFLHLNDTSLVNRVREALSGHRERTRGV
ncbi:protein kinase family protein [Candidatus Kaiserbacteria bacterium]|nr:protein kinase family protein [Candidatus Kaiserbacteria bacterium]USN92279.1 MAG: protein kinase family protein [Candidatus Nomurabacteria bacterium]